MAAYAATVTSTMKRAVKVDQITGFGMFMGRCDVTNYNQTLAEITDISKKFGTLMEVVVSAISDNGYLMRWCKVGKAFKAYYPTAVAAAHTHAVAVTAGTAGDAVTNDSGVLNSTGGEDLVTESAGAVTATAALQVASDVDVGVVEFVAYGLI